MSEELTFSRHKRERGKKDVVCARAYVFVLRAVLLLFEGLFEACLVVKAS